MMFARRDLTQDARRDDERRSRQNAALSASASSSISPGPPRRSLPRRSANMARSSETEVAGEPARRCISSCEPHIVARSPPARSTVTRARASLMPHTVHGPFAATASVLDPTRPRCLRIMRSKMADPSRAGQVSVARGAVRPARGRRCEGPGPNRAAPASARARSRSRRRARDASRERRPTRSGSSRAPHLARPARQRRR